MQRRNFVNIMSLAPLSFLTPSIFETPSLSVLSRTATPLRIGVVGLVHTHVHWILGRQPFGDIEIVGIVEPNRDLAQRYARQHGYSMDLVFDTIEAMVNAKKPEAVTVFTTIYDHLKVVEYCAPKGIHVMVEKPLAVSLDHAQKMNTLARRHHIQLLTNYETTWYGTHRKAWQYLIEEKKGGQLRKIVFRTGHQGPKEIGVNKEFLEWLTDPVLNGAGVLIDFGCYGSNIATWLMQGQKPLAVSCITQQIKPEVYPKVEDECTILLTYPKAQVVIQASWNWPFNVKETQVYAQKGYVICEDRSSLISRFEEQNEATKETIADNAVPYNDPFAFLAAVCRRQIQPPSYDLSSLENNMIVMEVLEAAKQSARSGSVVKL